MVLEEKKVFETILKLKARKKVKNRFPKIIITTYVFCGILFGINFERDSRFRYTEIAIYLLCFKIVLYYES